MRRGCISSGNIQCDDCHRTISYPECYLIVEEAEGAVSRLCTDCCLKKGYAGYKLEKGERVTTFFVE